jgi:hypothetical protein
MNLGFEVANPGQAADEHPYDSTIDLPKLDRDQVPWSLPYVDRPRALYLLLPKNQLRCR